LQGQHDTALNARGRLQAAEAARRLAPLAPDLGALDFVASPLARTRETMDILLRSVGLAAGRYRSDPGFAELSFGSWEGRTWKELRKLDPARYALRERDRWSFTPPGGESYATLAVRVAGALQVLSRDSALVSHGGVARALLTMLCGLPAREAIRASIWQGQVLVFQDGRHRWA